MFHSGKRSYDSRKRIVAEMEEKFREFEERHTIIAIHMKISPCIGRNKEYYHISSVGEEFLHPKVNARVVPFVEPITSCESPRYEVRTGSFSQTLIVTTRSKGSIKYILSSGSSATTHT